MPSSRAGPLRGHTECPHVLRPAEQITTDSRRVFSHRPGGRTLEIVVSTGLASPGVSEGGTAPCPSPGFQWPPHKHCWPSLAFLGLQTHCCHAGLHPHIATFSCVSASSPLLRAPIIELSQGDFISRSLIPSATALFPNKTAFSGSERT